MKHVEAVGTLVGFAGGLLLLKQSAERCSERPVILVLDALRRERFQCPGHEMFASKKCTRDTVDDRYIHVASVDMYTTRLC